MGTALLPQALIGLPRAHLEQLAQSLIDHLDAIDGEADLEEDDPAGQCDEDGINTGSNVFWQHGQSFAGPGCVLSDDDFAEPGAFPAYGIDQTHCLPSGGYYHA